MNLTYFTNETLIISNRTVTATGMYTRTGNGIIPFYVVFLLLAFVIVFANMAVLALYFKTKPLHTSNNHLLISLAFTDLFAGAVNIPLIALSALMNMSQRYSTALNFAVNVISDFVVTVNELNLFLIFADRYLVICHPLYSRKLITRQRRLNGIATAWIISVIVAIVPLAWCFKVVAGQQHTLEYRSTMLVLITYHSIAVSVCCFILPSMVMLFFLISMIRSLRMRKRKRKERLQVGKVDTKFRAYHKAFCMLSAMFVSMLVAWSPLMIVRLFIDLKIKMDISPWALNSFMLIRFVTAQVNPFIYTFVKREFRKAFFMTFRCFKCW